jgi:hypothetical protein
MTGECPNQWAKWLPLAEWWYDTNYHSATKMTPYQVLYGVPPPLHIPYLPKDSVVESVDEYLSAKEEIIKRVREHLLAAQNMMTMVANRKRSDIHPVFHVSQLKKHKGNHTVQGTPPMIPQTAVLQP